MDQLDLGWSPLPGQTNVPPADSPVTTAPASTPGVPWWFICGQGFQRYYQNPLDTNPDYRVLQNETIAGTTYLHPFRTEAEARAWVAANPGWVQSNCGTGSPPPAAPPALPMPGAGPPQPVGGGGGGGQPAGPTCPVQPPIPMCPPPDVIPPPVEAVNTDCKSFENIVPFWDSLDTCAILAELDKRQAKFDPQEISQIFGLRDNSFAEVTPKWLVAAVTAVDPLPLLAQITIAAVPLLGQVANVAVMVAAQKGEEKLADKLAGLLRTILEGIGSLIACAAAGGGCNIVLLTGPTAILQIMSILEKLPGVDFTQIKPRITYWANYACPSLLPDQSALDAMRQTGEITPEQWVCFTRAVGNLPVMADHAYQANQARLDDLEIVSALRRGLIDQDYYNREMQRLGYSDSGYRGLKFLLSEFIPTQSDLIPFMVRDVFDPKIVEKYRLSEEFEDKFQGKATEWAEANGIGKDVMKYYWMAHWQSPSLTQVYEMLWRNRPGEVPEGVQVTKQDVADMISINDITPFWQRRLLNIAYQPLTNTEAKGAYSIGAMTKGEFRNALLDNGKDPKFVDIIVNAYEQEAIHKGTTSLAARHYKAGGLTRPQTEQALAKFGAPPELTPRVMNQLDDEIEADNRAACVSAIKKRFELGDVSLDQLTTALINAGVSLDQANRFVSVWQCELGAKGKQLRAMQLCPMMKDGLISADEAFLRLLRMNYTRADAMLMLRKCQMDINTESMKQAQKQADAEAKAAKQAAKDQTTLEKQRANAERAREKLAAQRANQAAREAEKAAKASQRQALAAFKATAANHRKLASLIAKIAKKVSLDQTEVADTIMPAVVSAIGESGLSVSDAINVLGDMNVSLSKNDGDRLRERYNDSLGGFKRTGGEVNGTQQ